MLLLLSYSANAKMQNSDGTGFGNHADIDAEKRKFTTQEPFTEEKE